MMLGSGVEKHRFGMLNYLYILLCIRSILLVKVVSLASRYSIVRTPMMGLV